MRLILTLATAVLITLGSAGSALATDTKTITVSRGVWACTIVFVDNNDNDYPDLGDAIVSSSCTKTLP